MSNLDKFEVFKKCGFNIAVNMPNISFHGYDEVMDYCYTAGRMDINRIHVTQPEDHYHDKNEVYILRKKCKDLETANSRLFERNHELQVDNEQYKAAIHKLVEKEGKNIETIDELRKENLEYSKRCDELRKYNTELARSTLKQDIESVPKSKFVITVEEF